MHENKWIKVDKRTGLLFLRFSVRGHERHFFLSTGLEDCPANRTIVKLKRDQIYSDIALERFDSTLEKYKFQATRNTPAIPLMTSKVHNYNYDLAELWEKYTEFKKAIIELTTILNRYKRVANSINLLPVKTLDKAVQIRDWLLKNKTHYIAWDFLTAYSECCDWAVDSALISINPFQKLKIKPPKSRSMDDDIKAFTLEQRDLIIETFENHQLYSHYAPFIKFCFLTGCRPGEAFALIWGDVQERCTRIHINKSCNFKRILKGTKNNRRRIFPTSPGSRLQQTLLEIQPTPDKYDPSSPVFTTKTGKPMNGSTLVDIWNIQVESANAKLRIYEKPGVVRSLAAEGKVPYLRPYAMRHTFATWAIASGITPDQVALWIGDTVQIVLKYYCHPNVVNFECPDF